MIVSCNQSETTKEKADSVTSLIKQDTTTGVCPVCHSSKDVIPIVYGLPTKAAFEKADSGKIYLGGCDADKGFSYYCKKDSLEF